ncbi:hypothetical protein BHE74_00031999, partial [Ensete ventricosum]
ASQETHAGNGQAVGERRGGPRDAPPPALASRRASQVKYSVDPLTDFKEPIVEVIRDGGVRERLWEVMEELVYCFVVLNSPDVHRFIAEAFLGACSPRLQLPCKE